MALDLTLQYIADHVGVSRMTVSRALRGRSGVSSATRQKILRVAKEIGYRPNPMITILMSNLRAGKRVSTSEKGTVLAFVARVSLGSHVRMEHFRAASEAAEKQGYRMDPFFIGSQDLTAERLNHILMARGIYGLILAPLSEDHGHFDLDWSRFCVVSIEYTFVNPTFDRVVHDVYASMRTILEKCQSGGYRRVGLLFSKNGRERTEGLYEAAYWFTQKNTKNFCAIPPLCLTEWSSRLVSDWMARNRVDAIITSASFFNLLHSFLKEKRLRVPEDVALINVNILDQAATGITQNADLIGAAATRLLIDKMGRNDTGVPDAASTILIPGVWVNGATMRSA